jgi:hypothetical protein
LSSPDLRQQLLDAALRYAELGYRVFPCWPGTKKPIPENGFYGASSDPAQIEVWWKEHPLANVAMPTEGLLGLDIDGKENAWLAESPEKAQELACGPLALTPRGGRHFYFRQPGSKAWRSTTSRIAPHVDTRADGGYVLLPPSRTKDGAYRWAGGMELDAPGQLPEPPAWLVELLDGLATEPPQGARVASGTPDGNVIPDGQRNATLARLGGNMRRVGMTETEILPALIQVNADRCSPPLDEHEVRRIASSVARYEPDQVSVAIAEDHYAQDFERKPDAGSPAIADPGPVPPELLRVPGLISEVMDHCLETAPYPQTVLAFAGALSLMSFLAGRRVKDIGDNRTNLYVLALANSGTGKDHPRKINQRIIVEAGLSDSLGDAFASGEGLEDRLSVTPSMLYQTDEMDGLILAISQAKDARHENILNFLLKAYTFSNAIYVMRSKAGREHAVIHQPSLCLLGTAVPKYYYEALNMRMLRNGFFARTLILDAGKRSRGQSPKMLDLPARVIETARWWEAFKPRDETSTFKGFIPHPALVEPDEQAEVLLSEFREWADDQYAKAEEKDDPAAMAIWARGYERARKLALIHAVSEFHENPRVSVSAARWACEIVDYHTKRMLFMAEQYVADGVFDGKCKRVLEVLTNWKAKRGDAWMPHWYLSRLLKWSDKEIEEVRDALRGQERIEFTSGSTPKGGKSGDKYRLK